MMKILLTLTFLFLLTGCMTVIDNDESSENFRPNLSENANKNDSDIFITEDDARYVAFEYIKSVYGYDLFDQEIRLEFRNDEWSNQAEWLGWIDDFFLVIRAETGEMISVNHTPWYVHWHDLSIEELMELFPMEVTLEEVTRAKEIVEKIAESHFINSNVVEILNTYGTTLTCCGWEGTDSYYPFLSFVVNDDQENFVIITLWRDLLELISITELEIRYRNPDGTPMIPVFIRTEFE